jgi:hypothetical protein
MAKSPTPERCPGCGASFKLIDRVHRCSGRLLATSPTVALTPTPKIGEPQPITNAVTNGITNADRVKRWRLDKPDAYRAYMRDYMKRRRAAK